jgi:hypothetical protein
VIVAPIHCNSPRANAGFNIFDASIAPSAPPAPTNVCNKDAALERRFQPIQVDEPTVEDTIAILKGLRDRYEANVVAPIHCNSPRANAGFNIFDASIAPSAPPAPTS